jgi:N-hydroxyarylamine O-acetyltransferase
VPDSPNLDAYFHRIGYTGPRAPTLQTLRALHLLHTHAIPFENLDPLLNRAVELDLASLERKLLHEGRGGYCFEHDLLLAHILTALGFQVCCHSARVLYNTPEGLIRPRTHMLLLVTLDDENCQYITDVGFGGLTLTGPVRLQLDVEQSTPHEPFKVTALGNEFVLQAFVQQTWKPLFRFDLQKQVQADYEVANWYMATHPQSPFTTNLMTARTTPDRRYSLFNNTLSIHYLDGRTEKRILTTATEIRAVLEGEFRIHLPAGSTLDTALGLVAASNP